MTTPISIVSLNQGKGIYKDWTLETVDGTPAIPKRSLLTQLVAMLPHFGKMLEQTRAMGHFHGHRARGSQYLG
jgi:hypothetical protein